MGEIPHVVADLVPVICAELSGSAFCSEVIKIIERGIQFVHFKLGLKFSKNMLEVGVGVTL